MPLLTNHSLVFRTLALTLFVPSWLLGADSSTIGRQTLEDFVAYYCHQYSVSEPWVRAIIAVESNWKPEVVSEKGAADLMQIMPATARRFGVRNRFDSTTNIEAGVRYLAILLTRFKGDRIRATAAYFAGERRIAARDMGTSSPDVFAFVRKVYFHLTEETLTKSLEAPAARPRVTKTIKWPRLPP
jgi:soluble lytic murein transglycosylase-like protein